MLEESVRRIDRFRATHPEHPIVDVKYADLMRDPVDAVDGIYDAINAALDPPGRSGLDATARTAMTAYVAAHPKDGLGVHGYDLAEFGLDAAQLAERFSGYVTRYDIPSE
jgi:hypothetical protein